MWMGFLTRSVLENATRYCFFSPCRCFTITSFTPDMNIVGTCLVSNDIDIFLEVLILNNSSFAHILVMSKHGT